MSSRQYGLVKGGKMYCMIKGVHGIVKKVTWKEAWEMVRKGLDDPSGVFGVGLSIKMSL